MNSSEIQHFEALQAEVKTLNAVIKDQEIQAFNYRFFIATQNERIEHIARAVQPILLGQALNQEHQKALSLALCGRGERMVKRSVLEKLLTLCEDCYCMESPVSNFDEQLEPAKAELARTAPEAKAVAA